MNLSLTFCNSDHHHNISYIWKKTKSMHSDSFFLSHFLNCKCLLIGNGELCVNAVQRQLKRCMNLHIPSPYSNCSSFVWWPQYIRLNIHLGLIYSNLIANNTENGYYQTLKILFTFWKFCLTFHIHVQMQLRKHINYIFYYYNLHFFSRNAPTPIRISGWYWLN